LEVKRTKAAFHDVGCRYPLTADFSTKPSRIQRLRHEDSDDRASPFEGETVEDDPAPSAPRVTPRSFAWRWARRPSWKTTSELEYSA